MPIYEYHCDTCSQNFEYLVMGQSEPQECQLCNGKDIQRLMSACGFFSKGGGGETVRAAAGTSACGSCTASSCSSCGH